MNRALRLIAPAAAVLAVLLPAVPASAAAPTELTTIRPGEDVVVDSPITVNVVMVGYEPDAFDAERVLDGLPATARPSVRSQDWWYGVHDEVGLEHRYEYQAHFAGDGFDDAFFAHLAETGEPGPAAPTAQWYNAQEHNVLEVPSEYLYVDAVETERWLERRAADELGIGPDEYTVFLISWWGRDDFQFHVYQAAGDPDPDTGVDQGLEPWAQLISWGGSTGRSWFLDLSAGPEYWQAGFEVDTADLTGDGRTDHRLPPVWEYGNTGGYRPFDDLEGDLSKAVRHVAINALFTGSPLYDPTHFVPAPGGDRLFDISLFQGDPDVDGLDLITPELIEDGLDDLAPYLDTEVRVSERPLTDDERRTLHIAGGALREDGCWNRFGYPLAQVSCWFGDRAEEYWPAAHAGADDAVVRGLAFTLTDEDRQAFPFPGLAEDDYVTGTPAMFVTNVSRSSAPVFGGHTYGTLHSGGHMLGLSHGFDGHDPEQGQLHGSAGSFYMWLGDGVQSPMSKMLTPTSYGVFDRDKLDRWMVGGLLNRANADADAILRSPAGGDGEVRKLLRAADKSFGRSLDAFAKRRWSRAAALAVDAYDDVQRASARAGVASADEKRVRDSHDRYANKAATTDVVGSGGHPCVVPDGVDADATSLPPACAHATGAGTSRYCSIAAAERD